MSEHSSAEMDIANSMRVNRKGNIHNIIKREYKKVFEEGIGISVFFIFALLF